MGASERPIKFLTNCSPLEKTQGAGREFFIETIEDKDMVRPRGKLLLAKGLFKNSAIIIHQPGAEIVYLAFLHWVFYKWTAKIIAVDFQFSKPKKGFISQIKSAVWKFAWSKVDLVLGHMKYNIYLNKYYGIDDSKFYYIPFKVNGLNAMDECMSYESDYIFSGGYSWRNYDLLFRAMAQLPDIRLRLLTLKKERLTIHNTYFKDADLPDNVTVFEHDLNPGTWMEEISKSRCVVLPISPDAICSNGISVALQAMALGKCLIITNCPAVEGIFIDRVDCFIVDPADTDGMAKVISEVVNNSELRRKVAEAGRLKALSYGGVDELMERIMGASLQLGFRSAR
ncbi:MAG: glycosyltransferase family 4 protein [Marinobacter adhaerens]|uniref:Glycosyltransferase family 4 protein n=1 Tax=Marinobacter adhaerens TaxID=1033846 RepID=A0A844I0Q8_9GAMM|nr:glycosyltransferase family 4 protein [Marinobacter adhaerens]